MEYKFKEAKYEAISPGTIGVAQKISSEDRAGEALADVETSKLVFLAKNDLITCGQNQY